MIYLTVGDLIKEIKNIEDKEDYKVALKVDGELKYIDGVSHVIEYNNKGLDGSIRYVNKKEKKPILNQEIMFLYQKGSFKALNDEFLYKNKKNESNTYRINNKDFVDYISLGQVYDYLIKKDLSMNLVVNIQGVTNKARICKIKEDKVEKIIELSVFIGSTSRN